jgi:hypothetical protein
MSAVHRERTATVATWTTGFKNYLAPGATVTLAFTWAAGEDPGVQSVIARPKPPASSWLPPRGAVKYQVTTEAVHAAVELGAVANWGGGVGWGGYGIPKLILPYQPRWTYLATVRNSGQLGAWCELVGGKVS